MRTRNSSSGEDGQRKEVLRSPHKEVSINDKTINSPIVRTLRSRIITSDTEDDVQAKSKTPKSQRRGIKENAEYSPKDHDEVTQASNKLSLNLGSKTRTPKPRKRLSSVNLFRIVEEQEEINIEESKGKVKDQACAKIDLDEELSDTSAITCNDNAPVQETGIPTYGVVKEVFVPDGTDEDFSDQNIHTPDIKEGATEKMETQEEDTKKIDFVVNEPMESGRDSDSDDSMPEAVSFSSAKNTISAELSVIADALRREKEKRKDGARRRMEMIMIQKAEKDKRRKQKMKLLEVSVPERLPEDVASSLPDKPVIPTVKMSVSKDRKRKNEEKEKLEHGEEEKKNKIQKFDDYIPITGVAGSTQFGVVPLEVASRLPKSSSQTAAEFKQKALFGSRIPREPSKNLLIYRQKLSAGGKSSKDYASNLLKT